MAGTITLTHDQSGNVRVLRWILVADSVDGSIPPLILPVIDGRLLALETVPGSPSPTGSYDIQLTDQSGHDLLEGVGLNRSASAVQKALIRYGGTEAQPAVDESDTLTLIVENNMTPAAEVDVNLYYSIGYR